MSSTVALELQNVSLRRGESVILHGVSWRVPIGACAAILGPNGSGKSTIARILACHLWPSSGDVFILGRKFGETNLLDLRKSIRLVQPAGPFDVSAELSTRDVVLTGYFSTIGLYDPVNDAMRAEADRLLARVGLSRVADHAYATLSSGEKVRALISRSLVLRPALLLLDEPTAGLDLLAREQVLATVQAMFEDSAQPPPTVIIITHHVEELPPATSELLLLDQGRVAASGAPTEVLQAATLSRVYQCPLEVTQRNGRYQLSVHPDAWRELLNP